PTPDGHVFPRPILLRPCAFGRLPCRRGRSFSNWSVLDARQFMNAHTIRAAALTGAMLLGAVASAQGGVAEVGARNGLFSMGGTSHLSPSLGIARVPHPLDLLTVSAAATYNFSAVWAIDLRAGYAFARHTGVANESAQEFLRLDPNHRMRVTDD